MTKGWTKEQHDLIKNIILKYFPYIEIIVFGSRLHGNFKEKSNLYLYLKDVSPLDLSQWSKCEEEISHTDIPYKVDLSDWHRMGEDFQQIIKRTGKEF